MIWAWAVDKIDKVGKHGDGSSLTACGPMPCHLTCDSAVPSRMALRRCHSCVVTGYACDAGENRHSCRFGSARVRVWSPVGGGHNPWRDDVQVREQVPDLGGGPGRDDNPGVVV